MTVAPLRILVFQTDRTRTTIDRPNPRWGYGQRPTGVNITLDCESLLRTHTSHKSGEFDVGSLHIPPYGDEVTHSCEESTAVGGRGVVCPVRRAVTRSPPSWLTSDGRRRFVRRAHDSWCEFLTVGDVGATTPTSPPDALRGDSALEPKDRQQRCAVRGQWVGVVCVNARGFSWCPYSPRGCRGVWNDLSPLTCPQGAYGTVRPVFS